MDALSVIERGQIVHGLSAVTDRFMNSSVWVWVWVWVWCGRGRVRGAGAVLRA